MNLQDEGKARGGTGDGLAATMHVARCFRMQGEAGGTVVEEKMTRLAMAEQTRAVGE